MEDRNGSFKEDMRTFPLWQMTVICFIRFLEPIAFTSLFPYVYFMIRDFHVVDDVTQISRYSGYLASAFAFSQFLCCVQWGRLSEKIGRKPILLFGQFGTSICMLWFGFSQSFMAALLARTAMGALNGNVAVLRTVIGEIVTVRAQQGIAFATVPFFWSVGCFIGPMIGGSKYLTNTGDKIDPGNARNWYEYVLNRYPYSLSNVFVAVLLWMSIVVGFLFLEESQPRKKNRKDYGLEIGDWIRTKLGYEVPVRPWQKAKRSHKKKLDNFSQGQAGGPSTEGTPLLNEGAQRRNDPDVDEEADDSSIRSFRGISQIERNYLRRRFSTQSIGSVVSDMTTADSTISEIPKIDRHMLTPPVIGTLMASFLVSFQNLVYSEFLPVFLAAEFKKDHLQFPWLLEGGFGYSSATIGTLLSSTGFVGMIVVMFIFPFIDRFMRPINSYRVACAIFPLSYFNLAFLIYTLHGYNEKFPENLVKILLYINAGCNSLASGIAFPQINILTHRSSPTAYKSLVNALALSVNSFARFLSPLIWGTLVSYLDRFALGQVTWLILSFIALFTLVQAFFMDDYDEG